MDLSLLQDIVSEIERHPECDRIKKLMHWVCTQQWCTNPQTLNVMPLMMGLVGQTNTPNQLEAILLTGAQQLNKQQQYHQIGQLITQILAPLYPSSDSTPIASIPPQPLPPQTPVPDTPSDYDLFEVRLAVMKYTIALKAKILICAALEQQILIKPKHWYLLKQFSLDELLHRLYQRHSHWQALDHCLRETAVQLDTIDQMNQVVQAVSQAFKPLYQANMTVHNSPTPPPVIADPALDDWEDMTSVILSPTDPSLATQCWSPSDER